VVRQLLGLLGFNVTIRVRAALRQRASHRRAPSGKHGQSRDQRLFVKRTLNESNSVPIEFALSEDSINRIVLAVRGLSLVGVGVSIELVTWEISSDWLHASFLSSHHIKPTHPPSLANFLHPSYTYHQSITKSTNFIHEFFARR
jgi:hypothetical protein